MAGKVLKVNNVGSWEQRFVAQAAAFHESALPFRFLGANKPIGRAPG
jgi:hypothetical protein